MIANFGIGYEAEVPHRARLSSDYVAGRITAGEYNERLAALENRPFCRTTWSKVKAGDVVLMFWASLGRNIEVEVELVEPWLGFDGKTLVRAKYVVDTRYSRVFDPEETVYVQQR